MAKPKPIAQSSTETELAGLLTTHTNLQARQSSLAAEVEKAVAVRRKLLIEDGDAAAIAEAERACREIECTAYGITDALMEIERRISQVEARIEAARLDAERERVAGSLEQNARDIEAAAANLATTLAAVAKAHAMLGITISGAAANQFDPIHGPAGPVAIANALVLQGFAQAMPELEIHAEVNSWSMYSRHTLVEGSDPVAIATEFGQRLRETASKVRSREIEPDLIAGQDFAPLPAFDDERQAA